jgi:hypothetical protein
MIPKVGDLVRLNPAGCGHENMSGRFDEFGGKDLRVTDISSADNCVHVDISVESDPYHLPMGFFIVSDDGRYFREPKGTAPLFMLATECSLDDPVLPAAVPAFCRCASPELVDNVACGKWFKVCRRCGNERT